MDLSGALQAPFRDPEWVKKTLFLGLLLFIPIVGSFIVSGWSKRWYQARLEGAVTLPGPLDDVGGDLGRGFAYWVANIVAGLPLALPVVAVVGGAFGAVALEGTDENLAAFVALGGAGLGALLFLPMIPLVILTPALTHEHLRTGSVWVWGSVGDAWARVRGAPAAYVMLWVSLFVAQILGQVGVYLCLVGIVFTLPLAAAIRYAAFAAWAKATDSLVPDRVAA